MLPENREEKKKNENVKAILNMFSKHGVVILADQVKKRLFIYLCPEADLWRVATLRVIRTACMKNTLYRIDRTCETRFSVYLQVTELVQT